MGVILFRYQVGKGFENKGVSITMKNVLLALVVLALGVLSCKKEQWPPTNALVEMPTPQVLISDSMLTHRPDRAHFVPGHFWVKSDVSAIAESPFEPLAHSIKHHR